MAVGCAAHQDFCKFFVAFGKTEMQAVTSQSAGVVSVRKGCFMTAVTRTGFASPSDGTMSTLVAYTPDIEACMALAVCSLAALPGKS